MTMGTIKKNFLVKMFCGVIYNQEDIFSEVKDILISRFGEIDIETQPIIFDFTNYYQKEMGDNLKRRFISFKKIVYPDDSYLWKIFTNQVEEKYFSKISPFRRVNIDPGYLNLSRMILLSTKDYFHRIYLQNGIFAELTLYYQNNDFLFFPWTYPDYKTEKYLTFFREMREKYKKDKV